jgi:hypothetical protein
MKTENNFESVKSSVFLSTFENFNIKGGADIVQALAEVFQNGKNKINVALMLDKYLSLYPDTKI